MLFFEKHFNRHHFFHAPHKWFLAFLTSPIHFLELHYQKKYHLKFANAKKLFIFDVLLLCSIFVLIGTIIFLLLYNPSLAPQIRLKITTLPDKITSGDNLEINVSYKNESKTRLVSPELKLELPKGFLAEGKITTTEKYLIYKISDLRPEQEGEIKINGHFIGNLLEEEKIVAKLTYLPEIKKYFETKIQHFLITSKKSNLVLQLEADDKLLSNGKTNIKVKLTNKGSVDLPTAFLPLPADENMSFFDNNNEQIFHLEIEPMKSKETKEYSLILFSHIKKPIKQINLQLTPQLLIDNQKFPQETTKKDFQIITPETQIKTYWENEIKKGIPGKDYKLNLLITNTGDIDLKQLQLALPLNENVDTSRLLKLNQGKIINNKLILNPNFFANLIILNSQASTQISFIIPIKLNLKGENIALSITPELEAKIDNLDNIIYSKKAEATTLNIGTNLNLYSEIRYFTNEGDQIGRGPLPPTVNKETKYGAIIQISNTTSAVSNLLFKAKLPNYVSWTNKSSVSQGTNVAYHENTRELSWNSYKINPHEKVVLYFELAFIPTQEQVNTTPILLQNIQLTGHDEFIQENISISNYSLDSSLKNDAIAKQKGIKVK